MARAAALLIPLAMLCAALLDSASAEGQRRRHREPPPVPLDADVTWTVFVSAYGEHSAERRTATAEAGSIELPDSPWSCTYSTPNRAQLNATNWSEVRTLECTRGEAVVSTTGFCQIAGASWGARAAVLSLGGPAGTTRVSVTLDCAVGDTPESE